jgi:hypothetical protein
MRSHFFGHSWGAAGDRRISKYEMRSDAMHDKKMQGGLEPTNSLKYYRHPACDRVAPKENPSGTGVSPVLFDRTW